MNELPSREEFIENLGDVRDITIEEWDKDLYKCPQCNGAVKRDYSVAFMVYPPKYRYFCKECGYSEYL